MSNGEALDSRARATMPGGVNSATRQIGEPFGIARAEGATVVDVDGNEYIDYHAAFGMNLLGYHNAYVDEAVVRATRHDPFVGLGVTEREVEFAELIADCIPSVESVIATMSGTESTFQAIRLARAATGRSFIIKFQGNFHGWHDAVARNVISPESLAYGLDPLSKGILPDALEHTLIAEYNDISSVRALFAAHPGSIAAVILEPIAHNIGCVVADQDFLTELRRLTTAEGSVLIFDEVITGFRHSLAGFQAFTDVQPDLTTFGKALGNGYPIAGLGGRNDLMQMFAPGGGALLAGTFNGNPSSVAAAIATITYIRDEDPDFYARTAALTSRAVDGLRDIFAGVGIDAQVLSFGSVFTIYFMAGPIHGYRDLLRNDDLASVAFHRRMLERGAFMLPIALKRNHVSGAHTAEDIDRTLDIASSVTRGLVADGLLGTTENFASTDA